jgi:hypothetical protein
MAEIERIAQELRALDKRPLPATEDQIKALVTLAERERPLTLSVNSEAVAKLLMGKVEQQTKAFEEVCDRVIRLVSAYSKLVRQFRRAYLRRCRNASLR